jgi:hypothetical protein
MPQGDGVRVIHTKYFFTRKLLFLKESSGVALFPGGFGTMEADEPAIAGLARIVFRFDSCRQGRLRQLIDRLSDSAGDDL